MNEYVVCSRSSHPPWKGRSGYTCGKQRATRNEDTASLAHMKSFRCPKACTCAGAPVQPAQPQVEALGDGLRRVVYNLVERGVREKVREVEPEGLQARAAAAKVDGVLDARVVDARERRRSHVE
eukprot:4706619-Pleurochrysis_carterae.AAC.6